MPLARVPGQPFDALVGRLDRREQSCVRAAPRFGPPAGAPTRLARFAVGLLTIGLLGGGCVSAQVSELREHAREIDPGEAVTILLHYHSRQPSAEAREGEARQVEEEIVGCVSTIVRRAHPTLRIVPPDEFRRVAFPDLPAAAAPRSPEYISLLLDHPVFRERIARLNLRYVIAIGGATTMADAGGVVAPVPSPRGVLIFKAWDRSSRLAAAVLDLKEARSARIAEVEAAGRGWFVGFLLPIGVFPTFTETQVCEDLGQRIAQFLSGAEPMNQP